MASAGDSKKKEGQNIKKVTDFSFKYPDISHPPQPKISHPSPSCENTQILQKTGASLVPLNKRIEKFLFEFILSEYKWLPLNTPSSKLMSTYFLQP